jgi:hypothetical protein
MYLVFSPLKAVHLIIALVSLFHPTHRPVRDGIFVTANFNWRVTMLIIFIYHAVTAFLCRHYVTIANMGAY